MTDDYTFRGCHWRWTILFTSKGFTVIPRYDCSEISRLWTEEARFQTLLKVELAILEAQENFANLGLVQSDQLTGESERIPQGTSKTIRALAKIKTERINAIEREVHHDVIAFCTSITEQLPSEIGKYFHYGVTSSDILDTALSLQMKESMEIIIGQFEQLLKTLLQKSLETKEVMTIGRSHGMYAEPMSFGQKLLGHYAEFYRRYLEFIHFYQNECTAQFSGAVGNYTILSPEIEMKAASLLGLTVEPVSTQVIPRDRVGKLLSLTALLASAIERLAVEVRHLHRSEVSEVHEGFAKGQKGSSTMPHKKNPISGENLTGLARVIRSHVLVGLEDIVLWHERDISHSSAERIILPDNLGLTFYCLHRLNETIKNLEIHVERIEERVMESSAYLSSFYLHQLLKQYPLTREEAYSIVQEVSFILPPQSSAHTFWHEIQKRVQTAQLQAQVLHQDSQTQSSNHNTERKVQLHSVESPEEVIAQLKLIYLNHVDEVFSRTLHQYPLPKGIEEITS